MRHHYEKPEFKRAEFGETYACDHPVYDNCTLFKIGEVGLAVIQQRYDKDSKVTWWNAIDGDLTSELYLHPDFYDYFVKMADRPIHGIYPTVTVRQIMWALRMKPLPKQPWETVFDHKFV